jgi:cell division protein FtsI/penicillin-binding protein 2
MVEKTYHDGREQKKRIKFVLVFLVVFSFVIIGRLFWLQVIKHNYYLKVASVQHWSRDIISAKRGRILVKDKMSVDGLYPLADNQTLYLVSVSPEEMYDLNKENEKIDKKQETAEKLAPLTGMEAGKLKEIFDKNHTYIPLKHYLSYDDAEKVRGLNLSGVYVEEEQKRYYPEGTMASQILGYVNTQGEGNYGLEQMFDETLAGVPGISKAEVDSGKNKIAFGEKILTPAKNGGDITLTINRDVQSEAEKIVKESVEKFKAENGSLVVMDPDNGEILAMANFPTYDPNNYKEVKDYGLFRNSSVTDVFEPGSIFKVITMAAGIDTKKVEPDTKYDDTGVVILNGYKIMNSTKKAWGMVDMTFVIQESLNTGTVFVLNQIGKDSFYNYLKKFKFTQKTGIEQPSEGEGVMYAPNQTNDHGYATMTFGQGISVTPIQMVTSFAAIINGGKMVKPHIVAEYKDLNGKKTVADNRTLGEVISSEASAKMRAMMVNQVVKGHGKQSAVKGYKVGGKTGTAQVPDKKNGGYDASKNIGTFIGFAPADSPRFVVLAKIDAPKGLAWAESSAAPMSGKMLDFLLKYYQIPPTEPIN